MPLNQIFDFFRASKLLSLLPSSSSKTRSDCASPGKLAHTQCAAKIIRKNARVLPRSKNWPASFYFAIERAVLALLKKKKKIGICFVPVLCPYILKRKRAPSPLHSFEKQQQRGRRLGRGRGRGQQQKAKGESI